MPFATSATIQGAQEGPVVARLTRGAETAAHFKQQIAKAKVKDEIAKKTKYLRK